MLYSCCIGSRVPHLRSWDIFKSLILESFKKTPQTTQTGFHRAGIFPTALFLNICCYSPFLSETSSKICMFSFVLSLLHVFRALLCLSVISEWWNSQWISCFMKICECMKEKTHNWCQFRGRGRQNIAVIHSAWQWLSGQTKCVQSQTHHSTVSPARWQCNKQCGEIWPFAVRRKNVE